MPPLHSMSFEGSPSPAAPHPHPAGGSSRSGFPLQAGTGQGSIHLKFLLDLKLRRAAGEQQLHGEHPPAPRAGRRSAGRGRQLCLCV